MSNGTRFTTAQLSERGFSPDDKGSWSKNGVHNNNSKSPDLQLEHSKNVQRKAGDSTQEKGKEDVSRRYRYRLVIHSYRTELLDPSNPCFKALEDCLTNHGIIPDDSWEHCDQPIFLQTRVAKGQERTEIEVLRIEI